MTQLFAQPYDISANGFYFETVEEYQKNAKALRNDYGDKVEEFEIQFIDGKYIDYGLARTIGLNQVNIVQFFDCIGDWDEGQKQQVIIAVGECGYAFDASTAPSDFDVEIYEIDTMCELAEQFVDDGLFGEVPESFQFYIDYDAIARDLAVDYSEVEIAGKRLIYRCN